VIEFDDRDSILMLVLINSVLAFRSGVPNLDILVSGTSDDLSIIWRNGNGEHISGVSV